MSGNKYNIFCRFLPSTIEARIQIDGDRPCADLQYEILHQVMKNRIREIGPHEISIVKPNQTQHLPSTQSVQDAFQDEAPPYKVNVYIMRNSDIPFEIKLLKKEQIVQEEYSSDEEFLEDYKGYTFTKIDDQKTRSATFLLKLLRKETYNPEDVWLPTLGKKKDALKHEQVISYGFEEATIRRLEKAYIVQKRRIPLSWEARLPPSTWRHIRWKDEKNNVHMQEWEGIWGQEELLLLECKLCMTFDIMEEVINKLETLQQHFNIKKVYLAALLWRGDTLQVAKDRGFFTIEQTGNNLEVNEVFTKELQDMYI